VHQSYELENDTPVRQGATFQDPTFQTPGERAARGEPTRARSDQRVRGSEPTLYQSVMGAVERNPLLALAAVGAIGAITVMALSRNRRQPSRYEQMERGIRRQADMLEKTLRDEMRRARVSERFDGLSDAIARGIGNIDFSRFAWIPQAGADLYDKAKTKVEKAVK
jgi:hypothetical protein